MLNGLDLFSGGLASCSEALAPFVQTIAYCEVDEFRQRMLLSRQFRGEIHRAPIWPDVTTFPGHKFHGLVDIITAQPPCQDVSFAGLRKGMGGGRTSLLWHVIRIAKETKASFVFIENTPGLVKFSTSIRDALEGIGYKCRDGIFAAGDCGARHERKRWFMLAYSNKNSRWLQSRRREGQSGAEEILDSNNVVLGQDSVSDSFGGDTGRAWKQHEAQLAKRFELLDGYDWDSMPEFFHRMDHGIPYRSKRSGALGDTCPPAQYLGAFMRLIGLPSGKR